MNQRTLKDGEFVVTQTLGSGSFSTVYLGLKRST